jgi:hypothetical protein
MEQVRELLRSFRLEEYAPTFEEEGYDDVPYLRTLDEAELRTVLTDAIRMKPGHVARFVLYWQRTAA